MNENLCYGKIEERGLPLCNLYQPPQPILSLTPLPSILNTATLQFSYFSFLYVTSVDQREGDSLVHYLFTVHVSYLQTQMYHCMNKLHKKLFHSLFPSFLCPFSCYMDNLHENGNQREGDSPLQITLFSHFHTYFPNTKIYYCVNILEGDSPLFLPMPPFQL